jgi:hypothetical protein
MLSLIAFLLIISYTFGVDLYISESGVDSNICTSEQACKTFSKAWTLKKFDVEF